ncbi:MAG: T9SS sorting signal type C domain-containing protein, partial [Flavobacterium sp.]|nr:T9SS sorting signal type C domain-containing protein [Flavobacterium sp.]
LSLNIGAFGTTTALGMNTADYIQVSISIDGGIKFYPQLRISGNNNSIFDINNTLPTNIAKYKTNATVATIFGCTTNSTNTVSGSYKIINLPNVPDLRVQITFLSSLASKIWAVDNISLKGQLPLTSSWDGTNWLPTVPNTSTKAIIGSNYTTNILNGSIDSCECQINSGITVNVESNYYLDCESDFTNNGILNVKNNGSFIQLNDDAINLAPANNITRTTSYFEKYDYIYWSSPVIGTTISNTFSTWRTSRCYTFNTPTFSDIYSGLGYPQTIPGSDNHDDNGDEWVNLALNTTFVPAKGYILMPTITGTFPRTEDVTFSGVLNNGLKTYTLELSQNTANNTDDYNLVGNPFASAISADDFIRANITPIATANNITGTLAFWTHKGDIQPYTTNPGPYFNNYSANDYALYNLSGPVGVGSPSGSGSVPPSGFIASGQAFFIEAETTNDLVFSNSMRNKTYNNSQFFKQSNSTNSVNITLDKDRIWLNLSNTDNMFCQQLIAYIPGTTLDFDYGYDGRYNPANSYLGFYSSIDSDLTSKFKIQSRSDFNENDAVVIGYSSAVSGATSISIDHAEGLLNDSTTNVYLQDNDLNITHDLKATPYTFTTAFGTFNDRFVLKYVNTSLDTKVYENYENNIKIGTNNKKINVYSAQENLQSIAIFDITGRKIYETQNLNKKSFLIENINATSQALIVKIILENGVVVSRKIILD